MDVNVSVQNGSDNFTGFDWCLLGLDFCMNDQSELSIYHRLNVAVIGVILPLVAAVGIIMNLFVIFVYSRPNMRCSLNLYLVLLACSDTITQITAVAIYSLLVMECWHPIVSNMHSLLTPYVYPMSRTAQTCSVYITVVAALDVFLAVFSKRAKIMCCNMRVAVRCCTIVVLFSIIYNMPHWFELETISCKMAHFNNTAIYRLKPTWLRQQALYYEVFYTFMYAVFMTFTPLLSLIVLNSSILVRVFCCRLSPDAKPEGTMSLVIVVFLFIICNLLSAAVNELEKLELGRLLTSLIDLSNLLVVCNASFNFLIYYALCPSFRETFNEHVCVKSGSHNKYTCADVILSPESEPGIKMNLPYMNDQSIRLIDEDNDEIDEIRERSLIVNKKQNSNCIEDMYVVSGHQNFHVKSGDLKGIVV